MKWVYNKEMETEQRKNNEIKSWILSDQNNRHPPTPTARLRKKNQISAWYKNKKDINNK